MSTTARWTAVVRPHSRAIASRASCASRGVAAEHPHVEAAARELERRRATDARVRPRDQGDAPSASRGKSSGSNPSRFISNPIRLKEQGREIGRGPEKPNEVRRRAHAGFGSIGADGPGFVKSSVHTAEVALFEPPLAVREVVLPHPDERIVEAETAHRRPSLPMKRSRQTRSVRA
jgi:hypothetical protein